MQSPMPAAGEPIAGRCTKCRKNTDHVILTMGPEGPAKVQCTACNRQHPYRPPTVPKKKSAATRTVNHQETERKEWESLRPGMNRAQAQAYSMNGAYKAKALIDHPTFGLGLVQRVVGARKMEVLFEDGKKTMRCR